MDLMLKRMMMPPSILNSTRRQILAMFFIELRLEFANLELFKQACKDYNINLRKPIMFQEMIS